MKQSMYAGLTNAGEGVAAGANVAMEKSSEAFSSAGTSARETMDMAADGIKQGYGQMAEAAGNTMGAVSEKLDQTGFTEKAG